jgi:nitroimidazol reductase NimA-like FMN-containing flavoprotein (pyridoxamine 5'-phosphate oxidase superfamily)
LNNSNPEKNKNNFSEITHRSKINRLRERGSYDKETIYPIIDEAYYCHVSFVVDGQPFIIPTIHARIDDEIVLHGAVASRLLKHIQAGNEVCFAVTHLDGLVLARSVFHHSMNYRSVVLFGKGKLITDKKEKLKAAKAITDHVMPGRWEDARQPNKKELDSTTFVSIKIDDASAKIRTGPPLDEEDDYQLPVWAGVIPITQVKNNPVNDPKLEEEINLPDYLSY